MAVPFTLCYGCLSFTNTSIAKWKNESCLYMTIIPVLNILTKHIELHLGIIQTWKRPTIPYEMNEAILLFFQLHLSLIGFWGFNSCSLPLATKTHHLFLNFCSFSSLQHHFLATAILAIAILHFWRHWNWKPLLPLQLIQVSLIL